MSDATDEAATPAEIHDRLAAPGDISAARSAVQRGLGALDRLPLSYERALLEFASGQLLRRAGHRRAAANRLQAARERLSALNAGPDVERCDRELAACGLAPVKRSDFDPTRLTPQESAVAELVATGRSNRDVAAELFVSIKTVQFHLTHIYTKLGIHSRCELAARLRHQDAPATDDEQRSTPGQPASSPVIPLRGVVAGARARLAPRLPGATPHELTPQESAVAGLVATGRSNRDVAAELFVSIKTVQFHLTHVFAKLGVHSRVELAAQFCDETGNHVPLPGHVAGSRRGTDE